MQEATSYFLQLKAKKSAGHISAYSKASLPCSPAARTTSALLTPDISELEAGREKGRENPEEMWKFLNENVLAEGTDEGFLVVLFWFFFACHLKQKPMSCT